MKASLCLTGLAALLVLSAPAVFSSVAADADSDIQNFGSEPCTKLCKVSASKVKVPVNKTGEAKVSVSVVKGWKWNKQYPTTLKLTKVPAGLKLDKLKFKRGDFKSSNRAASVAVKVTGTKAGKHKVTGKLNMGICDEKGCIIRVTQVQLWVEVLDK